MNRILAASLKQAHLIWLCTIVNVALGFFIPGFNPYAQSISEVALEAPAFAYTHGAADIVIGISMCIFGFALNALCRKALSFSMLSMVLLGASFISAGIWTLESPLHLLYNLSIFVIVVPLAIALEFRDEIGSRSFENFSLTTAFVHVFMFWCIHDGNAGQGWSIGLLHRRAGRRESDAHPSARKSRWLGSHEYQAPRGGLPGSGRRGELSRPGQEARHQDHQLSDRAVMGTFTVMDPYGYQVWFYENVAEPKPPQGAKIV